MELKLKGKEKAWKTDCVLLVPLWNWNVNKFCDFKRSNWVLLVPLWNWNKFKWRWIFFYFCFTRTFMELKRIFSSVSGGVFPVLLVPLWNWNVGSFCQFDLERQFYSYLYGIETGKAKATFLYIIKFYSYLYGIETFDLQEKNLEYYRFTRTFMELKLDKVYGQFKSDGVLLVPLWNWNILGDSLYQKLLGFTRTFMELKRIFLISPLVALAFYSYLYGIETHYYQRRCNMCYVLLVPLWNWNNGIPGTDANLVGFTRTFMELKLRSTNRTKNLINVLLVPLWNWNYSLQTK